MREASCGHQERLPRGREPCSLEESEEDRTLSRVWAKILVPDMALGPKQTQQEGQMLGL